MQYSYSRIRALGYACLCADPVWPFTVSRVPWPRDPDPSPLVGAPSASWRSTALSSLFSLGDSAGLQRRPGDIHVRRYEYELSARERAVLNHINGLRFATSQHIYELLFHAHASRTQCDRTLHRLSDNKYLSKSKQWPAGGSTGGAFRWIYRLTPKGLNAVAEPRATGRKTMEHWLAIADCVVILYRLDRAGVTLVGYDQEPVCHLRLGSADLRPDLYAHVMHPSGGSVKLWLEVDMDSQGPAAIMRKMRGYITAYDTAREDELARWIPVPRVVFVAVDEARRQRLQILLQDLPEDDRRYFLVTTRDALPGLLSN